METKQCNKCNEIKPVAEYHKNGKFYYSMCKQCKCDYRKKNYERETMIRKIRDEKNKEKIKEQKREYRKNTNVYKEYRLKNKEKIKIKHREYYKLNKEKINKQKLGYVREKYRTDPLYRATRSVRVRINKAIKSKGYSKKTKTEIMLGCRFIEFKEYLESQWEPWMNWDNYGLYNGELNYGWDIDHIIPLSTAKTEEELIKLCHYSNLKPLCGRLNRHIKKDTVNFSFY